MKPIYFDYAASTPIDARVIEKMLYVMQNQPGNPSSTHAYGQAAKAGIEEAREQVASLLDAESIEIIWTSGATESINLAIKGGARLYQRKGKHIVTFKTEHKATLDTCQQLEKEGYSVTYLSPLPDGQIDFAAFEAALRADTILVSCLHVNNETGVIQDLAKIAALTSNRGILFHVDAAQSAGKLPIHLNNLPIDLLSACAHKMYGPKGVGILYVRKKPRVRVEPLIHGGGHEQGMRSGTLATHQMVGMGEACRIAKNEMKEDYARINTYRNQIINELSDIKEFIMHSPLNGSPYILNFRFATMFATEILEQIPGVLASTGSACLAEGLGGSHVLRSMGLSEPMIKAALRFSLGKSTSSEDVNRGLELIKKIFLKP